MPKSRGRRPQRGGKKQVRRSPRQLRRSEMVVRNARRIVGLDDPLEAEAWASSWLGQAWLNADMGDREAEHLLCVEVCDQARSTPSSHALAAVAALARVAAPADVKVLTETIGALADAQPLPPWHDAGKAGWTATGAWRAMDVWDSERVLLVDYDGPHPHTLMAEILQTSGPLVGTLSVLEPGLASRWGQVRADEEVPMPIAELPVADVLAELADALRLTDITWPRNDDDDFVGNRVLAWSRCREYLSEDWSEPVRLADGERRRLIEEFAAASGRDDEVTRSLADLFLDYGDGYIRSGPLGWSPTEVMLFMTDWLPRKAVLSADQRRVLPEVLRQWVTFALTQRGVGPQWITPVVKAVSTHVREFRDAFDDHASWGPAKQIAAALSARGVDLDDEQAVKDAVQELNAERLARMLTGEDQDDRF